MPGTFSVPGRRRLSWVPPNWIGMNGSATRRRGPERPLLAGRLAAVDDRFAQWAQSVGVEVASVQEPTQRERLVAEIDAAVALLYGLSEEDVRTIFETFHEGWDYRPRLALTLEIYEAIS